MTGSVAVVGIGPIVALLAVALAARLRARRAARRAAAKDGAEHFDVDAAS